MDNYFNFTIFDVIRKAKQIYDVTKIATTPLKPVVGHMLHENDVEKQEIKAKEQDEKYKNPPIPEELKTDNGNNWYYNFPFGVKDGHMIGKTTNKDGHILIIGGSGSGKSSCMAIPSLYYWGNKARVFCIDIKGELYKNTRHKRPNARVFNPLDDNTYGYDPFCLLDNSDNPTQEARAIAMSLVPKPLDTSDPFWVDNARNLLTGAILHFHSLNKSFVDTVIKITSTPVDELIKDIYDNTTAPEACIVLNSFVSMPQKTLSNIYTHLCGNIEIFATDKHLRNCLAREKNISPADLERGADIYINIPEYQLEQWTGLLTLITKQFLRHFEQRPETSTTPILFLLDEFARLGKIDGITHAFATLRSKKVTMCAVVQSLAQLDEIYGVSTRRTIVDNCQYKAILNATDADSQEYFSKLVGTYDKYKNSTDDRYGAITKFPQMTGMGESTEEKRIIKPNEFATLKDVVLLTPYGFCRADKKPYYKMQWHKELADFEAEEAKKKAEQKKRENKPVEVVEKSKPPEQVLEQLKIKPLVEDIKKPLFSELLDHYMCYEYEKVGISEALDWIIDSKATEQKFKDFDKITPDVIYIIEKYSEKISREEFNKIRSEILKLNWQGTRFNKDNWEINGINFSQIMTKPAETPFIHTLQDTINSIFEQHPKIQEKCVRRETIDPLVKTKPIKREKRSFYDIWAKFATYRNFDF